MRKNKRILRYYAVLNSKVACVRSVEKNDI